MTLEDNAMKSLCALMYGTMTVQERYDEMCKIINNYNFEKDDQ